MTFRGSTGFSPLVHPIDLRSFIVSLPSNVPNETQYSQLLPNMYPVRLEADVIIYAHN